MCIICLSLDKEMIDINQANEHLQKIRKDLEPGHAAEVAEMIWEKTEEQGTSYANYSPNFQIVDDEDDDTDLAWLFSPSID